MALVMTPIYTQIATGSASLIIFNNIPQYFTDLKLVCSTRSSGTAVDIVLYVRLNGDTSSSNYSFTRHYGTGSSSASDRGSSLSYASSGTGNGASATASTYANNEFYFSNYTASNFKSWIGDGVAENNAVAAPQVLSANLWRNTNAITSITVGDFGGNNFTNLSTFSLYGIIRSGA